ncbi:protein toll [Bacillus rossius redtenbacheri]|uniref:protein toll n=1 Tax=Bacillus rossius redtenbacheri TaxID=93214 RepID=UPI002FDE25A6
MNRGIGVAALLLLVAGSLASAWTCSSNCSCGTGPSYAFADCPSNLKVENNYGRYVKVTCYEPTTDLKHLDKFAIGPVPQVVFKKCSIPQQNYSYLLKSMGAEAVTQLDICDSTVSATELRDRLSGLDGVTSLSLNYLELTDIPEDFLQNVPQITKLDLRYNNMKIPLGVFDYVPNLRILELSGNGLDYLEPGLFRNLTQLTRLSAWNNRLQNSLTRETFMGLKQLVILDLHSNGIQELTDDVFAELHSLKILGLDGNHFMSLPSTLFTNTSMLEMVRFNDNRRELASLPSGFLANLTNLREAFLSRMSLSSLPEDLFHGSGNLINITLTGNKLRTLPAGVFRDTTRLLRLDLRSNKLEQLPDNIFSTLTKLQVLDLSNNQLTEINNNLLAATMDIQTLNLRQNAIAEIHNRAFFNLQKLRSFDISRNRVSFSQSFGYGSPLNNCKDLEFLNLSNNSIGTIFEDWRMVMQKLKFLDLSRNNITLVEVEDLIFLSRHVKVDLRHNHIHTINLYGAEAIAKNSIGSDGGAKTNTTFYLDGNPLSCDCNAYDFLRYLKYKIAPEVHSRFDLVPGKLTCAAPLLYQGMQVSDLLVERFTCGSEDTNMQAFVRCPSNCTCYINQYSEALIVDCSDAGLLHAPEEMPHMSISRLSHTQLLLRRNHITSLPNATQPGYENVTSIDISHNRLNVLQISQLPTRLKRLNLDHNNLTHLDDKVLDFLVNRTSLTLQGNPWSCSCDNRYLLSFFQSQFEQVMDLRNITCKWQNGSSAFLSLMAIDDLCPVDTALIVLLGITVGVVGLLLGMVAVLYHCYQQEVKVWLYAHNMLLWWVTEDELDRGKLFDAFVSFSHKDEEFVVNELVPGLEGGPRPFKLCLHFRDWIAGEFIPTQIARSVSESRRTLVVLSPNFLESVWGRMEFRAAHQQALSEGRARVILLLYGDIGPVDGLDPELKTYLSTNTYVKWGDPWFWDKLRYALPHWRQVKEKHYHRNVTAIGDKMDLMFPATNTPAATTPPADAINPIFIMEDKAALEKEAKLNGQLVFTEPPINCIKCV